MPFIIESQSIGIRNTLPDEIGMIHSIESQPENCAFVRIYSPERHQQVIDSADEEHLTIWDKTTNELIGYVILAGLEGVNQSLELRRLVIQAKGKGLGRQALRLLIEYCFSHLKFHRMWLDVYEGNERAIHLYRSEGLIEEGKLRDVRRENGRYRSMLIFSMLEYEYKREEIYQ